MINTHFDPFPELNTPRLLLRKPTVKDAADLFELRSDPEVMKYIPRPLAQKEADVVELLNLLDDLLVRKITINWAIVLRETGKVLGILGYVKILPEHFRAEVGYSLNRAWHRQGIMREALKAVVNYGFDQMNLHSIEAIIDAENMASKGVLDNFGFKQEAFFREDFFYNGAFRNSIHFGLLNKERQ